MATTDDYTTLVTSEHRTKPNFMSVVELLVGPGVDEQNVTLALEGEFDLDTAENAQLDAIGQWVGLGRYIGAPIADVYFTWDLDGLGWDQGNIKAQYDPDEGLVRLDDSTYRTMLKAKIGANHWDGTLESYQTVMQMIFAGTGSLVFGIDYQDMSMEVVVAGAIPSALFQALLTRGYFPMKPVTVRIRGYVISSVPGAPIFAWDAPLGSSYVGGWDTGGLGVYIS